jgi:hypothetical protein
MHPDGFPSTSVGGIFFANFPDQNQALEKKTNVDAP